MKTATARSPSNHTRFPVFLTAPPALAAAVRGRPRGARGTARALAAIGAPHPGNAGAFSETCRLHSPHSINAIGSPFVSEVPPPRRRRENFRIRDRRQDDEQSQRDISERGSSIGGMSDIRSLVENFTNQLAALVESQARSAV